MRNRRKFNGMSINSQQYRYGYNRNFFRNACNESIWVNDTFNIIEIIAFIQVTSDRSHATMASVSTQLRSVMVSMTVEISVMKGFNVVGRRSTSIVGQILKPLSLCKYIYIYD